MRPPLPRMFSCLAESAMWCQSQVPSLSLAWFHGSVHVTGPVTSLLLPEVPV